MSSCSLIVLLAARFFGVNQVIYFCHGTAFSGSNGLLRKLLYLYELFLLKLSSKTITVSPNLMADLQSISKNSLIHSTSPGSSSGVNLADVIDTKTLNVKCSIIKDASIPLKFCYVGRPVKRKGFHDLLSVFIMLDKVNVDYILDIYGFDFCEIKSVHQKTIRELSGQVFIHGFVEDVFEHVKSDVLLLPSYHEGFGYVILEAALRGLPSIASNVNGPRSIINDNYNGFLCEPGDIDQFFTSILIYNNSRDILARHMVNSCSNSLRFDRDVIVQQVLSFIE
jgi:glycosyltransferase involved in cell wall biosynthesis